jgi:hypothetical protein
MPSNWTAMDDSENVKIVTLQPSDQEYTDVIKDFQTQMVANYSTIVKVSFFLFFFLQDNKSILISILLFA